MGKRTFAALIVAAAAVVGAQAATHTVVPGDHLWGLAGRYYQNHFRWKAIYAANQDKIKDPHWIYPGQILLIPDVPGPEIGELPARPVEKESPVESPAPDPTIIAPAQREEVVEALPPPPAKTDDLSVSMPKGLAGQFPSMIRVQVDRRWKEDGAITEFEGREAIAGQGDWVHGKLSGPVSIGDRYEVYRPAAAQELDEDKKARYLQRLGLVKVDRALDKGRFRFVILKSGDSVQLGDLLKRESIR